MRYAAGWLAMALVAGAGPARAVTVERFTPQGVVKPVRQATALFSEPMVPFGDLRAVAPPFSVACPVAGSGRWVDARTWAYDFEQDLPGGLRCTFTLRPNLTSLAGEPFSGGETFEISTGGPSVTAAVPGDGSENIDERQAFVLSLDGEATPESIAAHAGFEVEGVAERIGVDVLDEPTRDAVVAGLPYWLKPAAPFVVIRARQTFANDAKVQLVWGAGIAAPSGVATDTDQRFDYQTRPRFTVESRCERENAKADCTPLTPLRLLFSAPVSWAQAQQVRLVPDRGASLAPAAPDEPSPYVSQLTFAPPFPPDTTYRVELPADLRDDADRPLAATQPLTLTTAPFPPLAKFAARFGLLEAHADPALPITIRNLDADTAGQEVRTTRQRPGPWRAAAQDLYARLSGSVTKIDAPEDVLPWLRRLAFARRGRSMFADLPAGATPRRFTLPQPDGPQAMQVVGLPFDGPGLYLVEIASPRLGAALLASDEPMYVPAGALVTNLSVHFKWARENALAWVTTLATAAPVAGAQVTVQDCHGTVLATATSDVRGIARFTGLPKPDAAPACDDADNPFEGFDTLDYRDYYSAPALTSLDGGLLVVAQTTGDMSFVHSSWQRGIEPWRFNLPAERWDGPAIAHTVLDRALFRAGDTVHMKHVLRAQVLAGFAAVPEEERPIKTVIRHLGSNETYELPLAWDDQGLAEQEWPIPAGAKLGTYDISLVRRNDRSMPSGSFRLEQFRVPLMRATVTLPPTPLVAAREAPVDIAVQYLAGGAAADLPVVLRSQIRDRALPDNDAYESFTFANGPQAVGIERSSESDDREASESGAAPAVHAKQTLTLDGSGTARATIGDLPAVQTPRQLLAEIEYRDPNGEVQTAAATVPLWPAALVPGIAAESWAGVSDGLTAKVVVLDTALAPVANAPVTVEALRRVYYSHRKRLVGGFYGYEHVEETTAIGTLCTGTTDAQGLLVCRVAPPATGNLIVQARVTDGEGRSAVAHADVFVDAPDPLGFPVEASDRMDVLPERRTYEPGETARFQVRMPFQQATALVTVEREGIAEARVVPLSAGAPRVEIPVDGAWAPNTFVSVLAVRGRVAGTQPTALVDLGKPAFKLGVAEIRVGWRDHTLAVDVSADRDIYHVRDTAQVKVAVRTAGGAPPPAGSEVAIAAVDEGLLELQPNPTWNLLEAMMGRRGYDVRTATAQMEVIGKRHYGRKAIPSGGGGGRQATRELFDTLLLWAGRVPLDADGNATVEVPLNDSLTAFRIVAVATGGLGLFGTGSTEIRSTQELMLLSGLPPLVRHGDRFPAQFTLRNTTPQSLSVRVAGRIVPAGQDEGTPLPEQEVELPGGTALVVDWLLEVPSYGDTLRYEIEASAGGATDRLAVTQQVRDAVPVRTLQATLLRAEQPIAMPIQRPADAEPDRGGIDVAAAASLGGLSEGVQEYLRGYRYGCLEQQTSVAVGLDDDARWKTIAASLPSYTDGDGLLKYFPDMSAGSEVLTAYVLSVVSAQGWEIPTASRDKMIEGLEGFVAGRISRDSVLRAPDLSLRKLAAMEALARVGRFAADQLDSITIEPALWPTSAVLDWWSILLRSADVPGREARLAAAEQVLRGRLNLQGTTMGFSSERGDQLWWLMVSGDVNATRLLLLLSEFPRWPDDVGRIARGALGRQQRGHWDTTPANAWGAVALRRFAAAFESQPVTGTTRVDLGDQSRPLDWSGAPPAPARFEWPERQEQLEIAQQGTGAPWITVASRAAIPLAAPLSSGYRITRSVTPIDPRQPDQLSRGDRLRVRLEIEAQTDMSWVVVDDPLPAGASHLGTGLARDSQLAAGDGGALATPTFVERRFDAWRAYFDWLPKGTTAVEYDIRLNQNGRFAMPPTRVEALYAPELFGEIPNAMVEVRP
ncbi:alpha-2-macroglobulin [bacterium]|nr:alpha-2-macroglobulin [bacterium]